LSLDKNKINSNVFFINNPDPNPGSGSEIKAEAGFKKKIISDPKHWLDAPHSFYAREMVGSSRKEHCTYGELR
jgi:hypothetical protein